MFKTRPCGCKGLRSCKVCEDLYGAWKVQNDEELKQENAFTFCPYCHKLYPGYELDSYKVHPNHKEAPIEFPGILIIPEFITKHEEDVLLKNLDTIPWDISQSGRCKQNYGPKCNFKKKKVKLGEFSGYPKCTEFIQDKFKEVDLLATFQTVEQCSLEYLSDKGSSIDPHIDDCWIWGERIPTLSLLSDSVLTLTKFKGLNTRYNLPDIFKYPLTVNSNSGIAKPNEQIEKEMIQETFDAEKLSSSSLKLPEVIRVPMPRRSLLVLHGIPRYNYEHGILRDDIKCRRVCITYRELTPPFLPGGSCVETGKSILDASKTFFDHTKAS